MTVQQCTSPAEYAAMFRRHTHTGGGRYTEEQTSSRPIIHLHLPTEDIALQALRDLAASQEQVRSRSRLVFNWLQRFRSNLGRLPGHHVFWENNRFSWRYVC